MDSLGVHLAESLRKLGLRLVTERYEPDSFGDALVVVESQDFRLRIVRDRGQLFVDVAGLQQPTEWFQLGSILRLIGASKDGTSLLEGGEEELAEVLRKYYSQITKLLEPSNIEHTKRELS